MTTILRKMAFAGVTLAASAAPAAEWFTPHVSVDVGVESAYISRGKVVEDRPIEVNEVDLSFDLGDYGRIGFNHWNYSCLSDKYQHQYRRFMPETDWSLYYAYEWKVADGWTLASQVLVMWQTYYGGKPEDDPSVVEYRLKQTLKNPYVTPFWKVQYIHHPVAWWYFLIGAKHTFAIGERFSLTPSVAVDFADADGRSKRFGARPDGSGYGAGVLSLVVDLTAEYRVTDWLSIHGRVGQFAVVDQDGRDNLEEAHQRDITFGILGLSVEF